MRRELETPAAPAAAPAAPVPAVGQEPAPGPRTPSPPPSSAVASEEVLDIGALGAQAAGRAALRIVSQPAFWIGAAVAFVLSLLLKRR